MLVINKKLSVLLKHAREFVPYYANLFPLPLDPGPDPLWEYFGRIPILTKDIIRLQKNRMYSNAVNISYSRKVYTSGTTGEPLEIIIDLDAKKAEAQVLERHIERCLNSKDWPKDKIFHLPLHGSARSCSLPSPLCDDGEAIKWNLIRLWQESDINFLKALSIINGYVITTMPSVIELLCSRIRKIASKISIRPKLVILSGEIVEENLRAMAEDLLQCPVSSLYTMAEAGIIASITADKNGYQEESDVVIVEIVNENGHRVPVGVEGDILVTPLHNRAMPLIRYRTGDRGYWLDLDASPPIFQLVGGRRPRHILNPSGASINIVRFAKIINTLNIECFDIYQDIDRTIIFSYCTRQGPLNQDSITLIRAIILNALGPEAKVCFRRFEYKEDIGRELKKTKTAVLKPTVSAEPLGPDLKSTAHWLQKELSGESHIQLAAITGSFLTPSTMTRFSDIDLVIFVSKEKIKSTRWIRLARKLNRYIPRLSINIDHVDKISMRAPLLVCRLYCERLLLVGQLNEKIIPWPSINHIKQHGLIWAQNALTKIWHKITEENQLNLDPIHEAYIVGKFLLDALRYRFLVLGEREIESDRLLMLSEKDPGFPALLSKKVSEILRVAREHTAPPLIGSDAVKQYFFIALSLLRHVHTELLDNLLSVSARKKKDRKNLL